MINSKIETNKHNSIASKRRNILGFICIILLAILFLATRLLISENTYLLSADETRYMGLARAFPFHTFYANTVYVLHPPFYSMTIAFLDLFTHDYFRAGLLISMIAALILPLILIYFLHRIGKPKLWIIIFLIFFTLNWSLITFSNMIFKESLALLLVWIIILCSWIGITDTKKRNRWLFAAMIPAFFLGITTDHVIFLFPILFLMIIIHNSWRRISSYLPIIGLAIGYGLWIVIRLSVYTSYTLAPVGADGVIETTMPLRPFTLITPAAFSRSAILAGWGDHDITKLTSYGYILNSYPFLITPNLTRQEISHFFTAKNIVFAGIYIALGIFVIISVIRKAIKIKNSFHLKKLSIEEKTFVWTLGTLFFFLLPFASSFGLWRYGIFALIPIFMLTTDAIYSRIRPIIKDIWVYTGIIVFICLMVSLWLVNNSHVSILRNEEIQGTKLASFMNILPGRNILVETGYSEEQAYLLPQKNIYGLSPSSENLERDIYFFNITYIAIGDHPWPAGEFESVKYIQSRIDLFIPIASFEEKYSAKDFWIDTYTIYKVNNSLN
ncbi:TPA: hypothetical protein HA235_06735 [Candidatus Woesearchaeota archaeon]|nr:hypothetical protein [uncultured archaeon]MBS3172833.1 hypothetical protein [Candidatus Woesearchaeota archaeon]HIH32373.1 hypothetical protein [Candidatus Woesearchaeota archaeon]HIH54528.1 hypothetical protein [Candidatus Woesearchaeota archaeon]HIJ02250.1 hypothetical protein [Candidatus Woesearchaeota archaeon]